MSEDPLPEAVHIPGANLPDPAAKLASERAAEERQNTDRRQEERRLRDRFVAASKNAPMVPRPETIFGKGKAPEKLEQTYIDVRNALDSYMVDLAEEVAIQDNLNGTDSHRHNSEVRRGLRC